MTGTLPRLPIAWGVAGSALEGGVSGDLHLVVPATHGALVGVIDGLGHGEPAAEAAREAGRIATAHAEAPLLDILTACHEGLRRTRGVVMSLAYIDWRARVLEWVGVGNVEGVLRRREHGPEACAALLLRGGVVGYRLPPLQARSHPLRSGDVLVLASDGIRSGFREAIDPDADDPQELAEALARDYGKGTDDALVLVVRYAEAAA